jgi:hypothetical protein
LLNNSILVDEDFHVRRAALALESNLHRLAGSEVAASGERCADEKNPLLAGVRDRDSVVPARLATDDIHGDQAVAHDPADQRRPQQPRTIRFTSPCRGLTV